jgi:hypothetical protein
VIFGFALIMLAQPATCGPWKLSDLETNEEVSFAANTITRANGERADLDTPPPADAKRFREQPARFIVTGMKAGDVVYTILDGNIMAGGIQVGTVGDNLIEVHGAGYGLVFANTKMRDVCRIELTRDGKPAGSAVSVSLMRGCYGYKLAGRGCVDELNLRDVRNRLALYLAWRRQKPSR